jgi:hypothetical protein
MRPEGLDKFKKLISSGAEPATFQLVAYCLNHYATACSLMYTFTNHLIHTYIHTYIHAQIVTNRDHGTISMLYSFSGDDHFDWRRLVVTVDYYFSHPRPF